MLKIREEQVRHLGAVGRRSLRDRVLAHVREVLGPGALPGPASQDARIVDRMISEALDLGLSWETHIAAYAALRAALGEAPLQRLGESLDTQAPKAEIAARFEAILHALPAPYCSYARI